MASMTVELYRRPWLDPRDRLFWRCLGAALVFGAVLMTSMRLMPVRPKAITHVQQLPPRFAKLVLDPPKPKTLVKAQKTEPLVPRAGARMVDRKSVV